MSVNLTAWWWLPLAAIFHRSASRPSSDNLQFVRCVALGFKDSSFQTLPFLEILSLGQREFQFKTSQNPTFLDDPKPVIPLGVGMADNLL